MLPEEANTPVRRIYFAIMMMYLDDKAPRTYYDEFVERTTEFINAISNACDESIRGAVISRLLNEGQEDGSGDLNIDGSGNAGRQVGQNR